VPWVTEWLDQQHWIGGAGGARRLAAQRAALHHQPPAADLGPRYSLDVKVNIQKIHMGSSLPSVQAGTPYQIIGFQNSVKDWSIAVYPAAVRRCQTCHNPKNGASQTEYCVLCHNPSNTDASARAMASNPADRATPPQGINFALMLHKIHTALNLKKDFGQEYVVVGFGTTVSAWRSLPFRRPCRTPGFAIPQMGPTCAVQNTAEFSVCHVNGSEALLPSGQNPVVDPQGLLNPSPTTTSGCTACHLNQSAFVHAAAKTDPKFGETVMCVMAPAPPSV
jgi:hypothetical protein